MSAEVPRGDRDDLDGLDARLRSSGRRVQQQATGATGDLDEVVTRSARRRRNTSLVVVTAFVLVFGALGFAGLHRGTVDRDISAAGDGEPARPTTTAAPPRTEPPGTADTTTPGASVPAADLTPDCDSATFAGLISSLSGHAVLRVDRFACLESWGAARVETLPGGPATYVFHTIGGKWVLVSPDADTEIDKVRAADAPVTGLYQIMGLAVPSARPTTSTTAPVIAIVEPDPAQLPPAGVTAAVVRRFVQDLGADSLHATVGDTLLIYDGVLLTPTSARRLTDEERTAIAAVFEEVGIGVEFVDITGEAMGTALLLADPSLEPSETEAQPEPGSYGYFVELQGCGHVCGVAATYLARPAEGDGWTVRSGNEPADPTTDSTSSATSEPAPAS